MKKENANMGVKVFLMLFTVCFGLGANINAAERPKVKKVKAPISSVISSSARRPSEELPCQNEAYAAIEAAVKAKGVKYEFGFELSPPEFEGSDRSGAELIRYNTLGVFQVEDGYISDSSGSALFRKVGKRCIVSDVTVNIPKAAIR